MDLGWNGRITQMGMGDFAIESWNEYTAITIGGDGDYPKAVGAIEDALSG